MLTVARLNAVLAYVGMNLELLHQYTQGLNLLVQWSETLGSAAGGIATYGLPHQTPPDLA